jgi:hypothetical protein
MVVSVLKKIRETGTKSANVVHIVDRAYAVWPRELTQAITEQGAGAAFIFQAIQMQQPQVRNGQAASHKPMLSMPAMRVQAHAHAHTHTLSLSLSLSLTHTHTHIHTTPFTHISW